MRIVGGSISTNCNGARFLAIGQRFADVNFLETSEPYDVTGGRMLYFDLLQSRIGKKRCDCSPLPAAVTVDADNRIADCNAAAYDAPECNSSQIIAVMQVRAPAFEKNGSGRNLGGGTWRTIASKSGVMPSLLSCSSRTA